MKNAKNISGIKLTFTDLSEQYPEHYYYLILAMYQEAYKRLTELKYQDLNNTLAISINKCQEFLDDIGKYLQIPQSSIAGMQPFARGSIREVSKNFQAFTHYTISLRCIYGSTTQHPLYSNLKCVIMLIDIMLKELIRFEAKVSASTSTNSKISYGN